MDSPKESAGDNEARPEPSGVVDAAIPWLLVALATLAAIGAVVRVIGSGATPLADRLDQTTLLYLAVSGALLLLKRIKTFSFGSYKLEMLEEIRERQVRTEDLLKHVTSKLLPLLLPEPERKHLMNLYRGTTANYRGGDPVQTELRRLEAAKLLSRKKDQHGRSKHLSDLKSDYAFDLADYVELSPSGETWVKVILENEAAAPPPAGKPAG